MDLNREVTLTDELIKLCWAYAHAVVKAYAEGRHAKSHALSSHGADLDPEVWAKAKMGECVCAILMGLDPMKALTWGEFADGGHDLVALNRKIDAKTIDAWDKYLCWPINKNHLYWKKDFDTLVLIKGNPPTFRAVGWMDKTAFWAEKLVADGYVPHGITKGTWCKYEKAIWKMDTLAALSEVAA